MTTLSPCRGVGLKVTVHQNTQVEPDVSFKLHPTEANILGIRTSGEDTRNSPPSIFAHPVQNPPWCPLKGPKIVAGCLLKDSVKNEGVQGRRGVGGRKPPPPEDQNTHASSLKTRVGEFPHLLAKLVFPFWPGCVGGTWVLAEGSSLKAVSTPQGPA